MTTLELLLDRIEEADDGPEVVAAFDFDGTLIKGFSAGAFYNHRFQTGELGPLEIIKTIAAAREGIQSPDDFAEFLEMALSSWAGKQESELLELGDQIWKKSVSSMLRQETFALLQAHRAKGHSLLLASSATDFQIVPAARELGIDDVACTRLEAVDGVLTGFTIGQALWGFEKANALARFADERGADLERSFAYSDGTEDIPFLEQAANPVAVNPHRGLEEEATKRGWPILRGAPKRGTLGLPDPMDVARTAAFYGSWIGAMGVGAGLGILRQDKKIAMELAMEIGPELALALAEVEMNVVGEEHLWSARPCVFMINHQSKLDVPLTARLLRYGYTGVAKKEAKSVPFFGQLFQLAEVAFIDRGNTTQAKEALQPAVDKIVEEGFSLVISPEGTRSRTPRLSPFKKGGFHVAMQAGVPIVPIVYRNAGEVMWRDAQIISPGTVDVAVLPPVDTSGWKPETVDQHRDEVQEMFERTLQRWPRKDNRLTSGETGETTRAKTTGE